MSPTYVYILKAPKAVGFHTKPQMALVSVISPRTSSFSPSSPSIQVSCSVSLERDFFLNLYFTVFFFTSVALEINQMSFGIYLSCCFSLLTYLIYELCSLMSECSSIHTLWKFYY